MPETLGPVDLDDPAHRAVLIALGARSTHEVQRARHRATEAMRAQTRYQGRYLGGRPPYGYRLIDVGPHPNASHARWGRRLQRLDPDPVTAGYVRRIFDRRLQGCSMAGIARELNEHRVPCPSAYDRARNRHRNASGWEVTTVAAILANPRYTGHQIWNRHHSRYPDHTAIGVPGTGSPAHGPNRRCDWVISDRPAHPALVTEKEFIAAQSVSALPRPGGGQRHHYQLVGVLRCGICRRRMISHWAHDRAWYRCRHGLSGTAAAEPGRPRTLYLREDRLLRDITAALRPELANGDVADYLRSHHVDAVCTRESMTIERD
ncbi:recombinase family protein [Actinoplanes sp. NPDC026623]|uniref:recombinase family protein n=1 Tax=Actinoplanes sp. NPDC026623 TaxID=3155610 RepID=UPI0033EC6F75